MNRWQASDWKKLGNSPLDAISAISCRAIFPHGNSTRAVGRETFVPQRKLIMKTKSLTTNHRRFTAIAPLLQLLVFAVLSLLAAGNTFGANAPTNFFASNLFPSPNGMYTSPQALWAYYANGVIISNCVVLRGVTQSTLLPTPGAPKAHSFIATCEMEISMDGGGTWLPVVVTNAGVRIGIGYDNVIGGITLYTNSMGKFDMSGSGLPAGVQIRQSTMSPSLGKFYITPTPDGYLISSIFDIYTEISTDNGTNWAPASSPAHIELKIDPQRTAAPVAAPRSVLPMPNGQFISTNYGSAFPGAWYQGYTNGVVIKELRQKLFTNWWEAPTFGQKQTNTFGSQLDFQYSSDGGAHFTPMRAPVMTTVKLNNVRGFMGRSTYETEVTQFDITGGDLPAGVRIRESPTKASIGGNSSLAGGGGGGAGGGAAINSFFDIYTEISTDNGVSWAAATNGLAHMELQRIAAVYTFTNNWLPPLNGQYTSPPEWSAVFSSGVVITNLKNYAFSAAFAPPDPGSTVSHAFSSQAGFDLSVDGGATWQHVTAPANDTMQITGRLGGDGTTVYYDTEMTQLNIAGGNLPAGVQIRESPTRASLGRTTASAVSGGVGGYQIDSFFDIYLEASVDGGQNWQPSVTSPATMSLSPLQVTTITIQRSGTNVVLAWPNGTLQCSTNVLGVYTNVSGATSPYTNPASGAQKFYRVLVQ